RRGRASLPVSWRTRRRHLRRRVLASAERGAGGAGDGPRRGLGPGGVRLPAAPLQPHSGAVARLRRRLRRRGRAERHRRVRRRRPPLPAARSRAGKWNRPPADAHPMKDAAAILRERARSGVALGLFTTYRVGGPADLFLEIDGPADLELACGAVAATGVPVL